MPLLRQQRFPLNVSLSTSYSVITPPNFSLILVISASEAAQVEIFTGVKFYCALCGMRFVRNVALKEHLNAHFEANLALKKRGDRTMARD